MQLLLSVPVVVYAVQGLDINNRDTLGVSLLTGRSETTLSRRTLSTRKRGKEGSQKCRECMKIRPVWDRKALPVHWGTEGSAILRRLKRLSDHNQLTVAGGGGESCCTDDFKTNTVQCYKTVVALACAQTLRMKKRQKTQKTPTVLVRPADVRQPVLVEPYYSVRRDQRVPSARSCDRDFLLERNAVSASDQVGRF